MAVIGYIRVSTDKQTIEHQHYEIAQFARKNKMRVDIWVEEKISSRKALKYRKLGDLLDRLKKNDILIACEISRLGRSLLEVMRILEICLGKNCQVWTLKENYRLGDDIQSKVLAFAFGLAAEIERNLISQRTRASLANIKAAGRKLGRPKASQSQNLKLTSNAKRVEELLEMGISKTEVAKKLGVQRSTLQRFILRTPEFDDETEEIN